MSSRKRKKPVSDLPIQLRACSSTSSGSEQTVDHTSSSVQQRPKLVNGNAKYNRIHYACIECYRRKQRCNRERPCQHCIARGIPETCKTYQPGDEDLHTEARLMRIERLLDDYLPRILHNVDTKSNTEWNSPSRLAYTQENCQQCMAADKLVTEKDAHKEDSDHLELEGRLSPETGLYNNGPTSHITSILDGIPGSPPKIQPLNLPIRTVGTTSDIDESMIQYGRPSPPSLELLATLISQDYCNILIDHYFTQINWIRQPLPVKRVRESFDCFWESEPKISIQSINIFAMMCNLCAIASLSVQHVLFPSQHQERSQVARRFHYAGRRALLMSMILGRQDVDQIIAWILSCHFLVLDRRFGEAYTVGASVISAALAIGLHRDGTKLGLSAEEVEIRRRVWAAVYCMDRALAVNTGRPALINDHFCDTQLVNDQADVNGITLCPGALETQTIGIPPPTTYTLTLYRQQLARLEGAVAAFLQSLGSQFSIGDVLTLDQKIQRFQEMLPSYYRATLTRDGIYYDASLDSTYSFLLTHRFLIHSDINGLRVVLLRPFLLRSRQSNGAKFAPTRQACIEAALHNAEMLRTSVRDLRASHPTPEARLVWRAQIGTQSWFQSLLICGLGLLMDPLAPIASRLKSHLEYYTQEYHMKGFIAMDDMSEREAKVIGMFLSRHEQVMKANTSVTKGASEEGPSHTGQLSESEAMRSGSFSHVNMAGRETLHAVSSRKVREARMDRSSSILAPSDTIANDITEPDPCAVYNNMQLAADQHNDVLPHASSSTMQTSTAPLQQHSQHQHKDGLPYVGGWQQSHWRPWPVASEDALLVHAHSHDKMHGVAPTSISPQVGNQRTMVDRPESDMRDRPKQPGNQSVMDETSSQPFPIRAVPQRAQSHPVLNYESAYSNSGSATLDIEVPSSSTRLAFELGMPNSSTLDMLLSPSEAFGTDPAMASASTTAFQNPDIDPAYWQDLIDKILS